MSNRSRYWLWFFFYVCLFHPFFCYFFKGSCLRLFFHFFRHSSLLFSHFDTLCSALDLRLYWRFQLISDSFQLSLRNTRGRLLRFTHFLLPQNWFASLLFLFLSLCRFRNRLLSEPKLRVIDIAVLIERCLEHRTLLQFRSRGFFTQIAMLSRLRAVFVAGLCWNLVVGLLGSRGLNGKLSLHRLS